MPNNNSDVLFPIAMSAPGEWSAAGKERFLRPDGSQFGGYISGLMLTAILSEAERTGAPISMTGAFLARTTDAPLVVKTERLRATKAIEFWQANLVQNGTLCAQSTVVLARRPESGRDFGWIKMPEVPPPESHSRDASLPDSAPQFLRSFERRGVRGDAPFPPDSISWTWARENDGHPVSFARIAMFADMFAPRVWFGTDQQPLASTVSFSTYFHATEAQVAEVGADFILLDGRSRRCSPGTSDLTAAVWRRDGLLLATTEQLWWVR